MKLTIKKLQSCRGREGVAYSCDLYADDVMVAHVRNAGNGGVTDFDWTLAGRTPRIKIEIWEYVASQPATETYSDGSPMAPDLDMVVAGLCDEYETVKKLKRLCKTKTLFRLPTDNPDDGWRVIKLPWDLKVKAYLRKNYGEDVIVANLLY